MHPTDRDKLLTLDECAATTGESVSTWTKRVQKKAVPFIRFSRVKGVRVRMSDLQAFIESKRQPAKVVNIA